MKIYFVRHGQTDWNIQNRLQGSADIPLNETGLKQANVLREKINSLDLDFIIASPLSRALTTAQIVNSDRHLPLYTDSALVERSFGVLEGINGKDYDKNLFWDYKRNYKYENVESIQDFLRRIATFLDALYSKYPDKNILLVSHNGVNIATSCYFNGLPKNNDLLSIKLDNCEYREYDKEKDIDR